MSEGCPYYNRYMSLGMYDEWRVLDALEQGPKTREVIEAVVKTAIGDVCIGVILLAHKLFSVRH